MDGLVDLGYDFIVFGPVSYEMNSEGEASFPIHLGIRSLKARLRSFNQTGTKQPNQQIGVSIIPSKDLVIYAPYLLDV